MVTNRDRLRRGWWLFGAGLLLLTGYVATRFVGTIVAGIFIYYATRPLYRRLCEPLRNRSLAAATALLLQALPAIIVTGYAIGIGVRELDRLLEGVQVGTIGPWLERHLGRYEVLLTAVRSPAQLLADPSFAETIGPFLDGAVSLGGFVVMLLLHTFVAIAIAFYLLRDGGRCRRWMTSTFGDTGGVVEAYVTAVDRDLSRVFFGNIQNALLTAVIGVMTYSLLNLIAPPGGAIPAAALLGLLAGFASLIPIVGMKLVYVPAFGYLVGRALYRGGGGVDPAGLAGALGIDVLWFPLLFGIVSLVVVDTIPDLVIRPYVSGRSLHVGLVMFAYIFGPLVFGWYGLFLGPLLLVLVVHFLRLVVPELLAGETIRPYAIDPAAVQASAAAGWAPAEERDPASAGETPSTGAPATDDSDTEGPPPSGDRSSGAASSDEA